jgi:hypothetical protein
MIEARESLAARAHAKLVQDGRLTPHLPRKGVEAPQSAARALRDWVNDAAILVPPAIVVPKVAVAGRVSLVSGREKIGKSTFVGGAIADASCARAVLGEPMIAPVRALWYAIDEHVSDAVRRFEALGADLDNVVINDQPRTVGELMVALELDLAAHPNIAVVVLDTLSRVLAASGVDPNSSREVEPVLARLVDFFHATGVAAILLYHTGKGGREYRGSTAIGATVDEILTLRRRGEADEDDFDDDGSDDGRRLLVQDGRTLRGRVHLTYANGVYRPYADAEPPRIKIISTLRDHGSVSGRTQLVKLAGVRKDTGLKTIAALIVDGTIHEQRNRLTLAGPPVPSRSVFTTAGAGLGTAVSSGRSHEFPGRETNAEPTKGTDITPAPTAGSAIGNAGHAAPGTEVRVRTVL